MSNVPRDRRAVVLVLREFIRARPFVNALQLALTIALVAATAMIWWWCSDAQQPLSWSMSGTGTPTLNVTRSGDGFVARVPASGEPSPADIYAFVEAQLRGSYRVTKVNNPPPTTLFENKSPFGSIKATTRLQDVPYRREYVAYITVRWLEAPRRTFDPQVLEHGAGPEGFWEACGSGFSLAMAEDPENQRRLRRALREPDLTTGEWYWPGVRFLTRHYFHKGATAVLVVVVLMLVLPGARLAKFVWRARRNGCLRCGYPLAQLPDALSCPECGWKWSRRSSRVPEEPAGAD